MASGAAEIEAPNAFRTHGGGESRSSARPLEGLTRDAPRARAARSAQLFSGALLVAFLVLGPALTSNGEVCGSPAFWRRAAVEPQAQNELYSEIARERAVSGYEDLVTLATALLAAAQDEPDPELSGKLAQFAAEAAPSDPRPHRHLLNLALLGSFQPLDALQHLGSFLQNLALDPWIQSSAVLRIGAILCLGAWAAVLALLLAGAASFGVPMFHDYSDSFPRRFRQVTPAAFAALVAVTLSAAGIGPAVLVLLIALIGAPYLPRRARVALGLCLGLGCLLPTALDWLARPVSRAGGRAWALYRVFRGDAGGELDSELARRFRSDESEALFARALIARRRGNHDVSADLLKRALPGGAHEELFRLELGNILFLQGDTSAALEEYARAAAIRPSDPIPWLNQHVVRLARLELSSAEKALERAKALDSSVVADYERRFPPGFSALLPMSRNVPGQWIRAELLSGRAEEPSPGQPLADVLFSSVRALRPEYFGLFALAIALLGGRSGASRRSQRCISCGTVICPRCSRRVEGKQMCTACWSAGRDNETDSAERQRQAKSVRKWRSAVTRWGRVGTLLLPGWGEFLFRAPRLGLADGALWAIGVGWIVQGFLCPMPVVPWGDRASQIPGALVLAASYLRGARRALGSGTRGGGG